MSDQAPQPASPTLASIVIYREDPLLYGKMLVVAKHADGRLTAEAVHRDKNGEHAREIFEPHELATADTWQPTLELPTRQPGATA